MNKKVGYFSEVEMKEAREWIEADLNKMNAGETCVTSDYALQWMREHPAECLGCNTYGIKHAVERSTRVRGKSDYLYCANNWVKYAMPELGWKVRNSFTLGRGVGKVESPKPTLHGLKINSENRWPWIRKSDKKPILVVEKSVDK